MKSTPLLVGVLICWLGGSQLAPAQRQSRAPDIPFADPSRFLENFFGRETAAERQQANRVPVSLQEEQRLGQAAVESLRRQLAQRRVRLRNRGEDAFYLQGLIDKLRPLMKHAKRYRKIQVYVADSDDTDARSFPGGSIIVFRGLIDFCQSEAALVGILGHELSHIDRGHQLYHVKRWKLMQQSLQTGFDPRTFSQLGGMFAKMFARPFRPEEETEADDDGARWCFALGYDPSQMAEVFARLALRDGDNPNFMPSFLRSHPFHDDRYRAILRRGEQLRAGDTAAKLYIGKRNLQLRESRFSQEFAAEFRP